MIGGQVVIMDNSSHSGKVDFAIAKKAGIDGVIIRMIVVGRTYDAAYFTNWANSSNHFSIRGIYVNAGTIIQCQNTLDEIDKQFPLKFPPLGIWVAIELQITGNFNNGLWLASQLATRNRGIVGIYSAKWVQDRDDKAHLFPELGNFPLWVAHYARVKNPLLPSYWTVYDLWQYSADGNNRGGEFGQTSDDVDLSVFWGTQDAFFKWVGFNPEKDTLFPIYKDSTTLMDLGNLLYDPTVHLFYKKDAK